MIVSRSAMLLVLIAFAPALAALLNNVACAVRVKEG